MHHYTHILLVQFISFAVISVTKGLSGHVCTRQKAETYKTIVDRAFICPERYTTACGQLDWRRCTKYRVNTCYTPTARYAIRYIVVEECCTGWSDTGKGHCDTPVCEGRCKNGGKCSTRDHVPICLCPEGYSGDFCQDISLLLSFGRTVALTTCVVILVSAALLLVRAVWKTKHRSPGMEMFRLHEMDKEHKQTLLEPDTSTETINTSATRPPNVTIPTAPKPD